jgi:hypothetical protein
MADTEVGYVLFGGKLEHSSVAMIILDTKKLMGPKCTALFLGTMASRGILYKS